MRFRVPVLVLMLVLAFVLTKVLTLLFTRVSRGLESALQGVSAGVGGRCWCVGDGDGVDGQGWLLLVTFLVGGIGDVLQDSLGLIV